MKTSHRGPDGEEVQPYAPPRSSDPAGSKDGECAEREKREIFYRGVFLAIFGAIGVGVGKWVPMRTANFPMEDWLSGLSAGLPVGWMVSRMVLAVMGWRSPK